VAFSIRSTRLPRVPAPSTGLIATLFLAAAMGYVLFAPFLHAPAMAAREREALATIARMARALDDLPASAPAADLMARITGAVQSIAPAVATQPVALPRRAAASGPASRSDPQAFRWSSDGYWFQVALVAAREPLLVDAVELMAWPQERDVSGSAVFAWHAAGTASRGLFQCRNMVQSYEGPERGPRPGASLPMLTQVAGAVIHMGRDRERWRRLAGH
jgi:hypothetical protein